MESVQLQMQNPLIKNILNSTPLNKYILCVQMVLVDKMFGNILECLENSGWMAALFNSATTLVFSHFV